MKGEGEKCAGRNSAKSGPFGELTFSEAEQLQFLLASQPLPYAEPAMGGVNPHKTQSPHLLHSLGHISIQPGFGAAARCWGWAGLGHTTVSNRYMAPLPWGLPAWGTWIDTYTHQLG